MNDFSKALRNPSCFHQDYRAREPFKGERNGIKKKKKEMVLKQLSNNLYIK